MDTQPSRERPVIVIVEDDVATLDLLCELLTEEGYQTVCCRTVNDAQERVRQDKPDLVILDVHLEGSASGLTVLDMLRLTPATAELPFIICSADTTLLKERAYELSLGNLK
jgi:CheY-like chemotaxis protein